MKKTPISFMLLTGSLFLQAQSGDLDATFNGNGVAIGNYTEDNNSADAMVVQADGKIVVAGGTGYASNIEIGVSLLNTDGTVDTTFEQMELPLSIQVGLNRLFMTWTFSRMERLFWLVIVGTTKQVIF